MATPGQLQMYNKLEINEMFSLDHRAHDKRINQIHRIHIYPDEKVPDAAVFHIWLEDHTLGNILRMELLRNENVLFAGYKVPHPLDHMIELRVQTLPKSSPEMALRRAVLNLRTECKSMLDQFDQGVAALRHGDSKQPLPQDVLMDQGEDDGFGGGTSSEEPELSLSDPENRFQEHISMLHGFQSPTPFSPMDSHAAYTP